VRESRFIVCTASWTCGRAAGCQAGERAGVRACRRIDTPWGDQMEEDCVEKSRLKRTVLSRVY